MGYELDKLMQNYGFNSGDAYAQGGRVKTHYLTGGIADLANNYDVQDEPSMDGMQLAANDALDNFFASNTPAAPKQASIPSAPMAPAVQPEAVPAVPSGGMSSDLLSMLSKYQGGDDVYGSELKTAREQASKESEAFQNMLAKAMNASAETAPSKAEMYFRLASAFGAPTKTGGFGETVMNVSKELGSQAKETREANRAAKLQKLQLGLEGQKLRMQGSKEDLATLRGLAGEEMKDKRAVAVELLKDYVSSGKPQSAAGKQAADEGLTPGTPAFTSRVAKIAEANIEKQNATILSALSSMNVAQANLALAKNKADMDAEKLQMQKDKEKKLTPGEMKLKTEAEDLVGASDTVLSNLKQAYALNPNTFDASLKDLAQRKVLEAAGSKDPKVLATREQENLLQEKALASLKPVFGGNPTEGERKILLDLQGIGAKSKEERAIILKNAYKAAQASRARHQKRLNEINQGLYRETTPAAGGIE